MVRRLLADFEIVEGYFAHVAGVEPDAPPAVSLFISNRGDELTIDVEVQLKIANSNLKLVRRGARANGRAGRPVDDFGFGAGFMQHDLVFRILAVVNQKTVVFQLAVLLFSMNSQSVSGDWRIAVDTAQPHPD